jgi:hypothetical protein
MLAILGMQLFYQWIPRTESTLALHLLQINKLMTGTLTLYREAPSGISAIFTTTAGFFMAVTIRSITMYGLINLRVQS